MAVSTSVERARNQSMPVESILGYFMLRSLEKYRERDLTGDVRALEKIFEISRRAVSKTLDSNRAGTAGACLDLHFWVAAQKNLRAGTRGDPNRDIYLAGFETFKQYRGVD